MFLEDDDMPRRALERTVYTDDAHAALHVHCLLGSIFAQEPTTFRQATEGEDAEKWLKSMEEELNSLRKLETFRLVDRPKGRRPKGFIVGVCRGDCWKNHLNSIMNDGKAQQPKFKRRRTSGAQQLFMDLTNIC